MKFVFSPDVIFVVDWAQSTNYLTNFFRLEGFLLLKDGRGIFTVSNDRSARCAHKGETGTDDCADSVE